MRKIYMIWAWIFGRPIFYNINRLLFELSLRGMGLFNHQNLSLSGEKWLASHFIKQLGEDLVIFDVGANVGEYSKSLVYSGAAIKKIFAFEPHPVTYLALQENIKNIKSVAPIQMALSDQKGKIMLYDRADTNGSSHASLNMNIFTQVHNVVASEREVAVDTIDNFCTEHNIDCIDFLKIDVEGYELNVLRGATGMLKERRVRSIQFEFTQLNSTVGIFFKNIYDILFDDYLIYRMLPHGLQRIAKYNPTTCELFGYQNIFAVAKTESPQ